MLVFREFARKVKYILRSKTHTHAIVPQFLDHVLIKAYILINYPGATSCCFDKENIHRNISMMQVYNPILKKICSAITDNLRSTGINN